MHVSVWHCGFRIVMKGRTQKEKVESRERQRAGRKQIRSIFLFLFGRRRTKICINQFLLDIDGGWINKTQYGIFASGKKKKDHCASLLAYVNVNWKCGSWGSTPSSSCNGGSLVSNHSQIV